MSADVFKCLIITIGPKIAKINTELREAISRTSGAQTHNGHRKYLPRYDEIYATNIYAEFNAQRNYLLMWTQLEKNEGGTKEYQQIKGRKRASNNK